MLDIGNKISIQEVAKRQIETTKQVYLLSPARMFSEYNGEKENVKNYNGRQLLEMLQNADDAASKARGERKVLIKLHGKQLIIANTGYPFSEEGLTSIFHSHLSPKEAQENQIGKKGLGFRSILSWADKVTIKSHDLCVAFSKEYSKSVLEELLVNPEFAISFNKLRKKNKEVPISTLVCPDVNSINPKFFLEYEKYDTIILIDLKGNSLKDVNEQIVKDLDGEVLLFLNYLENIELDINGVIKKYRKEPFTESKVKLTTIDYAISPKPMEKLWNINSIKGHFEEFDRGYQVSIAWKDNLDEGKDVIYSYFRTKVPFHFKGILHGTFELNADRNDIIQEDAYNKKIIDLIPELISITAEKIANSESGIKNYKALSFTLFENAILPALMQDSEFKSKLNECLKDKKILPTISNEYISIADGPVYYKTDVFAKFLPPTDFPDILKISDAENIKTYIESVDTKIYTFQTICNVISPKAHQYSLNEYALLIRALEGLVDLETEADKSTLSLFFDSEFNPLTFNNSIFLPSNDSAEKLPSEVGVQVIHSELAEALKNTFEAGTYGSLAEKMSKFKIKTFDFDEIIELVIGHYASEKSKIDDIKKLNQHIYRLYKSEKPPTTYWQGTSVPLISKEKKIKNANQIYFGREYGCSITETVYSYSKNKLLAPPKDFGIGEDDFPSWKAYLKWLGVADVPRKVQIQGSYDFSEYAFKKFDYKSRIGDYHFSNYQKFKNSCNRYGKIVIQSIDELEAILSSNKSETIIAWLCTDDSIYKLFENDSEPGSSFIEAHFGSDWYNRAIKGNQIRNFLKWRLSNLAWLNTKSGIKQAPILCTTSTTISSEFSPLIEKPDIDYDDDILRTNKINPDKVDYVLNLVGVNKTISSFETNTLYSILNKLSEIDPEGRKAKTLYRELAVNYEEKNLDVSEIEYKTFISTGKVFCNRHGEPSYENVGSVFYVDNKRYGESIIRQFYTIEIERRRSQEKIEKVFGVKPLKGLKLTLANSPELHNLNGKFEQEIESFKPFIYVFRQDLDTTGKEKNLIKDVRFKLVTDLSVLLEREKEKSEFSLTFYEYLYLAKNKTIYIKTPEYIDDEKKLKEDVSFCSTIAEAFSALIDVDAQRQQIRELFSKSPSGRDDIIRAELDDTNLEKLQLAKDKLGIVNDPKILFWASFIKCFPERKIKKEGFTDEELLNELKRIFPELSELISISFDQINYENYNEEISLRLIIDVLSKSHISLLNFNKYVYPSIDISELYDLDLKRAKENRRKEFKQNLYSQFINSEKDKKEFLKSLSWYDELKGNFQNEINYNVEADLMFQLADQFEIEFSEEHNFDFEKIYASNKKIYESKAEDQKISKELANLFISQNSDLESLLYFESEVGVLIEKLIDWIPKKKGNSSDTGSELPKKRITIGGSDFLYDDFGELFGKLESEGTFQTSLSKIKIKRYESESPSSKKDKTPGKRNPKKFKQPDEDLGFLGEWLVFKHLLSSIKNTDSIKWVSEYAKLAGVNSDGKNGLGYDLEYIPNDAKYPRYVEVKVVGWENAFHMSANEILQGERLKKHYEIFLVRNIGETDNISIEIIQGPFDYKGQRTFNDNELFTVINDSFILKFEKASE